MEQGQTPEQLDLTKVRRGDLVYSKKLIRFLPPTSKVDIGAAPGTSYAVMVIGSIREKDGIIDQNQLNMLLQNIGLFNVIEIQEALGTDTLGKLAQYCRDKFAGRPTIKFEEPKTEDEPKTDAPAGNA